MPDTDTPVVTGPWTAESARSLTGWTWWRKRAPTRMRRMGSPFWVVTSEGPVTCTDGWLALDTAGYPYPVDVAVHADSYEPLGVDDDGDVVPVEVVPLPEHSYLLLRVPDRVDDRRYRAIAEGLAQLAAGLSGVEGCIMLDPGQTLQVLTDETLGSVGLQRIPGWVEPPATG